jgi:dTDP-4-dehydrorhamnose 3,5-epimerase
MTETASPGDLTFIGEVYRHRMTTQLYGPKPRIDGILLRDLEVFSDEGGDFCEITRIGSDGTLAAFPGYRPEQISFSLMLPGTIKAWHLHERQDDLWFVPATDRLLIGLLDVRGDSETFRNSMRLVLGAGKARLLYIPKGVAHGVANSSGIAASILYFTDRAFDAENPDEHRLPHDLLGAEFWTIPPG